MKNLVWAVPQKPLDIAGSYLVEGAGVQCHGVTLI